MDEFNDINEKLIDPNNINLKSGNCDHDKSKLFDLKSSRFIRKIILEIMIKKDKNKSDNYISLNENNQK